MFRTRGPHRARARPKQSRDRPWRAVGPWHVNQVVQLPGPNTGFWAVSVVIQACVLDCQHSWLVHKQKTFLAWKTCSSQKKRKKKPLQFSMATPSNEVSSLRKISPRWWFLLHLWSIRCEVVVCFPLIYPLITARSKTTSDPCLNSCTGEHQPSWSPVHPGSRLAAPACPLAATYSYCRRN